MYNKETHRILSGSLNLVAPASEIPDHDAQKLENFTYDSVGNLRSRKGHQNICSASNVKQMIKALGNRWQATTASVLKDCGSIIAVANAMIVGYKGFIWAMSQSGQRKSSGANDLRWIPAAPTTAPVITVATPVEQEVVSFAGGWTVDPTGFESYPDGFLQISPGTSEEMVFSATKEISLDLLTNHSIDDVHQIRVWCKIWSRVKELTFEIDVNDGTFTKDYYVGRMRLKNINIGRKEEMTFYLRKRPLSIDKWSNDKKRYGWFERVGATPDKDWRSCVKARIKVEFTSNTKIRWENWKVVGDKDNTLEGDDIGVYVTFTTAAGHESNPSPKSNLITVNRNSVQVSSIPVSADPQVTGTNIYLTGGTLAAVLRANGARDTATVIEGPVVGASYKIVATEDELTAFGIEMETNHDDPPPASVLAGPYYDRLIAASSIAHPERVWWTPQSQPFCFPGANSDFFGNWNDVGDAGEKVMALSVRPSKVYIYKENSVHYLLGDPGDEFPTGNWHRSSAQMGISSQNGYVQAGPIDYTHMSEGIYRFNGDFPVKISQKIDPIFKGRSVLLSDATTAVPLSDVTDTALGFRDNVLWFSYTSSGGRKTIKFDIESSRWSSDSRGFTAFYYEGQGGFFVGALVGGGVVGLESGTTDNGAAITVDYLTKDYDLGRPDIEKTFEDFTVESSGASGLAVSAHFNGTMADAFLVALGSINTNGRQVMRIDPDGKGRQARTAAFRVTGGLSTEAVINKLHLNFYDESREGKAYDTDEFDAGTHKMKRIRAVAIDSDNTASTQILLFTDQPGFVMTLRDSAGLIAAASARRCDVHWFAQDRIGHLMRLVLKSEEQKIYKVEALIQVIGTWLHGSRSEFYSSDPLDLGSERIKLAKEFEIIYEASGGGALFTIESDLPGEVLVTRATALIPISVSERSLKIPLPGHLKGRLWRVTVTPEAATEMRIEKIRMRLKLIGEPFATPWSWRDLPVEETQDAKWFELKFQKDAVAGASS